MMRLAPPILRVKIQTKSNMTKGSKCMTAVIAISKCCNHKRIYGIRFEKHGRTWKYTWAFPVQEKTALREDYDKTQISGTLIEDEEYPGCPHCGAKGFFHCVCGKLNCWNGECSYVTCSWCGNSGRLSAGINSISITSNI